MSFTYQDFLSALRMRESSGNYKLVNTLDFLGAYQFGEGALVDLGFVRGDGNYHNNDFSGGWTGKLGIDSKAEFLNSRAAQDAAADEWFPLIWRYLEAVGADEYLGRTIGGVTITASGLLAGAHLLGAGAVRDWLQSGGTLALKDDYGTPIKEYIAMFGGFAMPFDTGESTLDDITGLLAGLSDPLLNRIEATYSNDGVLLTGDADDNRLAGGAGRDVIAGDDGNDTLLGARNGDALLGGDGHDTIKGGDGFDLAIGGAGNDRILGQNGRDRLIGDTGADTLLGGRDADRVLGGDGNDRLGGQNGNDKLWGGDGDDVLRGHNGADQLNGGAGDDTLSGGAGNDLFIFSDSAGHDTITDFGDGGDRIRLAGVESITGFADLKANHATQVGDDVVIETDLGDTLTLLDTALDSLRAGDFLF